MTGNPVEVVNTPMRILLGRKGPPSSRGWTIKLLWEPRDVWLGVFWNTLDHYDFPTDTERGWNLVVVYICILPCLPICFARRTT